MTVTDATSRTASAGIATGGGAAATAGGAGDAFTAAAVTPVVTAVVFFATGKPTADAVAGAVAMEVDDVDEREVDDVDERAATITTPATTAMTPRTIARSPYKARAEDLAVRTGVFDRFDRDCFALFTGPEIFFSESLWSLRSADSRYLIDRADFFAAFSRTASSSVNLTGSEVIAANGVPD